MDEVAAQFWASVVGALVGGLIAAITAVCLFVAERKAAEAAREQQSIRESERVREDLAAKKAEATERLLDAIETTLLELWLDEQDLGRAVAHMRQLKTLTRRAAAALSLSNPGAARWIGRVHYAAVIRSTRYIMSVRKAQAGEIDVDPLANANYNVWVNSQHDTFVGWRLGDLTDDEMLNAASALDVPDSKSDAE